MDEDRKVLLIVTMDTKGDLAGFVESCLEAAGVGTLIIDAGIMGECDRQVEVSREEVARAAGTTLEAVRGIGHEGKALSEMIRGAIACAREIVEQGKVRGVMGIGGSMGTTLGTAVMRRFPFGFPKLMVTTMASRDTRSFVGTRDILMLHSVCDLSGLNRATRTVLGNGAAAMAGIVRYKKPLQGERKPLVVLSTLGTTETCAVRVRAQLESKGYEVVVFHTVGSGGEAMDELIREHDVAAAVDLSLHELTDNRFGGDYNAGPDRGKAAMEKGISTVLIPGNTDFIVTGTLERAKKKFPGRTLHSHNTAITTIRTSGEELKAIGRVVGELCNQARGPVEILIPQKGLSAFDHPNGPMYDPEGPGIFSKGLEKVLGNPGTVHKIPAHVNDETFSNAVVEAFDRVMAEK
ncbi:MAG: Tm-1-like ATP-binding domain-containing protein [Desulfatiglandaceae bacterium]